MEREQVGQKNAYKMGGKLHRNVHDGDLFLILVSGHDEASCAWDQARCMGWV